ncbi:MAG: GGDEF domain-containing protein, partial [Desulfurellaceae bacterium]|nr:GGDEF domain-containing protein [Desulfurellaceae bacterium]
TKILNRRELLNRLKEELSRASRKRTPFYLFMLDIDHFKKVNDRYGHDAGDKVLVEVVNRIKSQLRSYDVVGRYGGEEFLIGISKADKEIVKGIAERLRRCICEKPFNIDDKGLTVSISIGLTKVEPSADVDLEAAIKMADTALYKAKQQGRNRVICIDE